MSPWTFSQFRDWVLESNFRSSSVTESPASSSFSARWLPINPFPPVIRTLDIVFNLPYRGIKGIMVRLELLEVPAECVIKRHGLYFYSLRQLYSSRVQLQYAYI